MSRTLKFSLVILAAALLIWYFFSDLCAEFALAALIAYLLAPAVDRLQQKLSCKRGLAVGILVFLFLAFAVGMLLFVIPLLRDRVEELWQHLQDYGENIDRYLDSARSFLNTVGINTDSFALSGEDLKEMAQTAAAAAPKLAQSVFSALGSVGLIGVSVFYLLLLKREDYRRLWQKLPASLRPALESFGEETGKMLHAYLKARLFMAGFIAIFCGVGFYLCGIQNALLFAVILFFMDFIPYIGPFVGGILPVFTAFLDGGVPQAGAALLILLAAQQLEEAVIGPKVQANAAGVHPLVGIFALIICARVFGAIGLILALPLAGAGRILIEALLPAKKEQRITLAEEESAP